MFEEIKKKVISGERLSKVDAVELFKSADIFSLGKLASSVAEKKNGDKVFFIRNRHINPTNICINRCRFCAFSRSKGEEGAFELTIEEIIEKLQPYYSDVSKPPSPPFNKGGKERIREVHIVGGLHPDWPFEYYLNMLSAITRNFPGIHIKAFTAVEIDYLSRISGLSLEETLLRDGLGVNLMLAVISAAGSILVGLAVAILRAYHSPTLYLFLKAYIDLLRSIPMIVLMVLLFFALPFAGISLGSITCTVVALSLGYGAYTAESFRAGIESVHPGQVEAARSLGLSAGRPFAV